MASYTGCHRQGTAFNNTYIMTSDISTDNQVPFLLFGWWRSELTINSTHFTLSRFKDPLSTSINSLSVQHPCPDPGSSYLPHSLFGPAWCSLASTHALTHLSHRHPILMYPPQIPAWALSPPDTRPRISWLLAAPAWCLLANTQAHPTHTQFGEDTDTHPHQQLTPGTQAVTRYCSSHQLDPLSSSPHSHPWPDFSFWPQIYSHWSSQ